MSEGLEGCLGIGAVAIEAAQQVNDGARITEKNGSGANRSKVMGVEATLQRLSYMSHKIIKGGQIGGNAFLKLSALAGHLLLPQVSIASKFPQS